MGLGLWQTRKVPADWLTVVRRPTAVMGTDCTMAAVVRTGERLRAEQALDKAEAELRLVEARMSIWLEASEISRFNAAGAGEEVNLSPEILSVLRAAREAAIETKGAFDATCGPVIQLWRAAGRRGVAPTEQETAAARGASSWDAIELTERGAIKRSAGVWVDLGGIAKGYGIDRATQALRAAEIAGGMVDVGGDLRCFGRPPQGDRWVVEVRSPFGEGTLGELAVEEGAVCTSGNYARFTTIEGKRYSHIIDPRMGCPADAAPSATVVAGDALTADVWATALSVLGADGFDLLPREAEALLVLGSPEDHSICCTPGMQELLRGALAGSVVVWDREGWMEGGGVAPQPRHWVWSTVVSKSAWMLSGSSSSATAARSCSVGLPTSTRRLRGHFSITFSRAESCGS